MYISVSEFLEDWKNESMATLKVLKTLTDASLNQKVYDGGRTLGYVAWHVVVTVPELGTKIGLNFGGFDEHSPAPAKAAEIVSEFERVSNLLVEQMSKWDDSKLNEEDNMYGLVWTKRKSLEILIRHELHHRAQMTILMRQAGLKVPGVYGPAKEEWAAFGMPALP